MVFGNWRWGSKQRAYGENPYESVPSFWTEKSTSSGQPYMGSRPGLDAKDLWGFARDELLGVDDFRRAGRAWQHGDTGQFWKSLGTGAFELGTALAIPFTGGTSVLARLAATKTAKTALNLGPVGMVTGGVMSDWTPAAERVAAREQSFLASESQREIDRFLSMAGRDASGRRIINPSATAFPDDPFLQWKPGMTSPFSQEGIQQAGTQVAMNQFGQQLAGLQPTQAAFFQSQLDAALRDRDRALGDIGEQESDVRRRTAQAGRRSRAAGAGEAADLQAAAAARGLMSSPASFDVGQDFIAATTAAEQAQQQAGLSSFLGQAERARGQIESDYRQFMDDVRRDRLAMQMENQQAQQDRLMSLLGYL